MNEHRLGKQHTKFVRVSEKLAVELQVFPFLEASQSSHAAWFEDRHLQEIVQLLRDHIFARVATEGKNDNVSKSGILTGVNIRLGYTFKKKAVRHVCLVLRHQDNIALNRASEDAEVLSGDGAYRHYDVFQEKVVVFVCPLKGASHSSMSQLMSAVGNSSQTASISSYFQRQPTVSQQSASASSSSESTAGSTKAVLDCKESKGKEPKTALFTSTRKRKIKSILARRRPKPSGSEERAAKKVKTLRGEDSCSDKENCGRRTEESDSSIDSHTGGGDGLEFHPSARHLSGDSPTSCDTSRVRYGDTATGTCDKAASEGSSEDQHCVIAGATIHSSHSEENVEDSAMRRLSHRPSEGGASPAALFPSKPHPNVQVSDVVCVFVDEETAVNHDHLTEEMLSSPTVGLSKECPNSPVGDKQCVLVSDSDSDDEGDSDCVSLPGKGKNQRACSGFAEGFLRDRDKTYSKEPEVKRSRVGASLSLGRKQARAAKDGSVDGNKDRMGPSKDLELLSGPSYRGTHSSASTVFRDNLASASTAASRVDDSSQSGTDCPVDDGLPRLTLKKRPPRLQAKSGSTGSGLTNSGTSNKESGESPSASSCLLNPRENVPKLLGSNAKGAASTDVPASGSVTVWEDEDLPVLTFKPRRYRQGRRVTELLRQSTLLEFQGFRTTEKGSDAVKAKESDCNVDADVIVLEISEAKPAVTKKQMLSKLKPDASVSDALEDLKKTYRDVRDVSLLSVTQVETIVKTFKKHLLRIFQGLVESRRHEEYKKGGPACRLLNDEMLATALTEEQQDAVMDALIGIFCRKHYEYIPYLLKVLLPETIICIYMVVHGLPYEQTEKELRQEYLVYPESAAELAV